MKSSLLLLGGLLASVTIAQAQARAPQTAPPPPPPAAPPVYPAATAPAGAPPAYVYDQKPITPSTNRPYLIAPDQAQSIINRFKDESKKLGNPRFLIYVNRDLVDQNSGLKLSSHRQVIETSRAVPAAATNQTAGSEAPRQNERVVSTNIYRIRDHTEAPLADRQTARDIERLFGRPLRMAGASLADQRVATQLIGSSRSFDAFTAESEQARKDREALAKVADVVIEILVSSKDATVSDLNGDHVYAAPDIQATAIRLSDSKILGQATAADLIGQGPNAGRAVQTFGVREITEATALLLLEDMMLKPE